VTLIELLVVMAIIAIMISILVPAVIKVRDAGDRAENRARLVAINGAMNALKGNSAFGNPSYIPAGRPLYTNGVLTGAGPFRLRNVYPAIVPPNSTEPDVNSFEAQTLIAMFNITPGPTGGLDDLGYRLAGQPTNVNSLRADLDANQTLVFFLGGIPEADATGTSANFPGFSTNAQKPFTNRVQASEPRKDTGIDLGGGGSKPKYRLSLPTGGGTVFFARLIDPYGVPYAYFVAYKGQANRYFGFNGDTQMLPFMDPTPPGGVIQPYKTGPNAADPYENPIGYQLISAGKDKIFGISGNSKLIGPFGKDDLTNIAEKQLGAGQ
jgi:type II secretory pathway pseudopilin PulG